VTLTTADGGHVSSNADGSIVTSASGNQGSITVQAPDGSVTTSNFVGDGNGTTEVEPPTPIEIAPAPPDVVTVGRGGSWPGRPGGK
jgi:hypothetical protein